ncbi:MAG: sulfite exporter TauE/SafE family protein, partial [Acidimicrobiales bacterium]|nr:sulfite exporter TauE/SafE family protein [Acidimicrobiales bacterium]
VLGTRFNHSVDDNILLLGFAGLMLIAAWQMWVNRVARGNDTAAAQSAARRTDSGAVATMARPATARLVITPALIAKVLITGTVVGLITGFFGVGGGFVIVPALVLALGFEMAEAVGTSLLVITINATVALVSRLGANLGIDWAVAIPFTVSGVMGVSVGKKLADRVPAATLVRWFVGLLVVTAIYIAIRATGALVGEPS